MAWVDGSRRPIDKHESDGMGSQSVMSSFNEGFQLHLKHSHGGYILRGCGSSSAMGFGGVKSMCVWPLAVWWAILMVSQKDIFTDPVTEGLP